jgi:EmrB/QacA subfamily drug resistance transporter
MRNSPSYNKKISFIVSFSFFMEAIDSTILNTAIPAISRSLRVDPVDLKVALLSYLLSLAIFIPISGWFADKYGAKKVFIAAMTIFTASSLWCGFAANLHTLIIARFIQGLGGALGVPVGRLIIVRTFGRQNLIHVMSHVIMIGALGMMLGPVIGGFLTSHWTWHWIFWVNIPIGILAVFLAYHWLPLIEPQATHALDKLGFILFGLALAGWTFGLSSLSQTTTHWINTLGVLVFSTLLLILYIKHSRKHPFPIVNVDLWQYRTFRISIIGNLLSRLGFGSIPFLIPLLLQISFGFSPERSGLLLAPTAIGVLFAKICSLRMLRLLGYKRFLLINTVLAGCSIWSFAGLDMHSSTYGIALLTCIFGFVISMQYTAMNSLAFADISPLDLSAATSIMGTLQQLAQSFGVAIGAVLLRFFSFLFTKDLVLTQQVFAYTFFMVGILTLLSTVVFARLQHSDGQEMFV